MSVRLQIEPLRLSLAIKGVIAGSQKAYCGVIVLVMPGLYPDPLPIKLIHAT